MRECLSVIDVDKNGRNASIFTTYSVKASKSGLYLLIISNMRSTFDLSDLIFDRIIDILQCDECMYVCMCMYVYVCVCMYVCMYEDF